MDAVRTRKDAWVQKRVKGGERREQILEVMSALLVEKGVEGFSMRRLAERVGISLASLQYHFSSKDRLMSAFLDGLFDRLHHRLAARAGAKVADPRAALEEILRTIIALDAMPENANLYIHLWALSTSDPIVAEAMEKHMSTYVDMIHGAVMKMRPDLSNAQALLTATMVVSTLEGLAVTHAAAQDMGMSTQDVADYVVGTLMGWIEGAPHSG